MKKEEWTPDWEKQWMADKQRLRDEIERLKDRIDEHHRMFEPMRALLTEAAAFLDVLAHHITRWPAVGNHRKEQQQAAAECRAMAERLHNG